MNPSAQYAQTNAPQTSILVDFATDLVALLKRASDLNTRARSIADSVFGAPGLPMATSFSVTNNQPQYYMGSATGTGMTGNAQTISVSPVAMPARAANVRAGIADLHAVLDQLSNELDRLSCI